MSSLDTKLRRAEEALQILRRRSHVVDQPVTINNGNLDGVSVFRRGNRVAFISSERLPSPAFELEADVKPDWVESIESDQSLMNLFNPVTVSSLSDLAAQHEQVEQNVVDAHDYTSSDVGARLDAGFRLLNPVG